LEPLLRQGHPRGQRKSVLDSIPIIRRYLLLGPSCEGITFNYCDGEIY